jgi:asparagine synthase (glutamine-hydrolysing)
MCGIAGILNRDLSPVTPNSIKSMIDAISHRGPDDNGIYCYSNIGIGHRRLSTIDLTASGHQPMCSPCGQIIIVYNGMLFNYRELGGQLRAIGFPPLYSSDTAVILAAWTAWGSDCINMFNGHFSLAVIDFRNQKLTLARDRYGTRPLYWCNISNIFLFASEIKSLLTHPKFTVNVDIESLSEYFTFQNFLTEKTLFKNVNLFPKATIASISINKPDELSFNRYWDYHFKETNNHKQRIDYIDELDFLIKQAVDRHMIADVEIGAYLSGGIDSGLVSALASRNHLNLKSFTCGFDISSASGIELGFDERQKAEAMSAIFKTEHYEMVLKSGDMERILPYMMKHIEEPRVGQCYPNYYVAKLASKFVKIVLSGTGGDELFAGYPWRYYRKVNENNFDEFIDNYYEFWQRLIPKKIFLNFFQPIAKDIKHIDTKEIFKQVFFNCPKEINNIEDSINLSLYFEAHTFLQGLLIVDDKLSMAHGLETRIPFLDNDLVEFALRCPVKLKLNNLNNTTLINENITGNKIEAYYQRTKDGKNILRKVSSKYIPYKIAEADKQGFSAPDSSWFRGESIEFIKRQLLSPKKRIYNYIDFSITSDIIHEHLSGKSNKRLLIWSLLCFDFWLTIFNPS